MNDKSGPDLTAATDAADLKETIKRQFLEIDASAVVMLLHFTLMSDTATCWCYHECDTSNQPLPPDQVTMPTLYIRKNKWQADKNISIPFIIR